jgi:hypothetical protein
MADLNGVVFYKEPFTAVATMVAVSPQGADLRH